MNKKELNQAIMKRIEEKIELPFEKEHYVEGAVCFANHEDVRSDFKLFFTTNDVVNYCYGIIRQLQGNEHEKLISLSSIKIPLPANAAFFWEMVQLGKMHCLKNKIEFKELSEWNWLTTF